MHYNGVISCIFVNVVEIYEFKANDINGVPLCLSNISKGSSVYNAKNAGLYGYVYVFSLDY